MRPKSSVSGASCRTAISSSFPSFASRATPAPTFSANRCSSKGPAGPSGRSPAQRPADRSWWSWAHRSLWQWSVQLRCRALSDGAIRGNRPQAAPAHLQGILREPLVPAGKWTEPPKSSWMPCEPRSAPIFFSRPRTRARRSRLGAGRDRDLRGSLGPDSTELASGTGRGHGHRSTSRPATRPSARAAIVPISSWVNPAAPSQPTPWPGPARRNRPPMSSSAATA